MIEELGAIHFVRKRPAMYIGALNSRGIIEMLIGICQELVNHSVNQEGELSIRVDGKNLNIRFSDYADLEFLHSFYGKKNKNQGNPFGLDFSTLNTFGAIVLSSNCTVEVKSKSLYSKQQFEKGKQVSYQSEEHQDEQPFIHFNFELDDEVFESEQIDFFDLTNKLYDFSILNKGRKTVLNFGRNVIEFDFPEGIKNLTNRWGARSSGGEFPISIVKEVMGMKYEIEFFFSSHIFPDMNIESFANWRKTKYHGSLIDGIVAGVCDAFDEVILNDENLHEIDKDMIVQRLNIVAHVVGDNLTYEGNTRERLGVESVELESRSMVSHALMEAFSQQPDEEVLEFVERFEKGWPWRHVEESLRNKGLT